MPGQALLGGLDSLVMADEAGRETVVAEDVQLLRQHIGLRAVRLLFSCMPGASGAIEIFLAAIKAVEHVSASQLFYNS
jgi:hypothetical protein